MRDFHISDPVAHLRRMQPDTAVIYFCPDVLQATARRFLTGFPGLVTYAVKANDRTEVLENLSAAGIEAFDPEPFPPDSEILQLENAFLSPHFGAITGEQGRHEFFCLMVDELARFFQGHETWYDLTPRSQANRQGDQPI